MHISVRGIVEYNDGYILIHRKKIQKDGTLRDYYVVPGGKQEKGENDEETLKREVFEEVGINVDSIDKILEYDSKYNDSIQKFYTCKYIDGVIGTGTGPEYTTDEYEGYIKPEIIKKEDIININLVPEAIKIKLIKRI